MQSAAGVPQLVWGEGCAMTDQGMGDVAREDVYTVPGRVRCRDRQTGGGHSSH